MTQFCAVCKKPAIQSCSACNSTYYCSKDHQKLHWKNHKSSCAPFKIVNSEHGKSLVAIRNIEPGENIVTKLPLMLGPISEQEVVCISCFNKIEENSKEKCPNCGLNFCGQQCANKKEHLDFCEILKSQKITFDKIPNIYKFLVPLKILLIKSTDFKLFDTIMSNYSYIEPNIFSEDTLLEMKTLCKKLGLSVTEEELSKIYVISKRNFIHISHRKSINTKGLYPVVPLLKQNCVPNTKRIFFEDANQLWILATIPIKKGSVITANFTEPLWGTLERQNYLKTCKFVSCSCERCLDPRELNTYASSIYCQKCKDKLLEDDSPKIVSTNPLNLEADWQCEKCENKIQAKQIIFGNKSLGREISSQHMQQPKSLEHFLFKYGEILHSKNSFSLRVKFKLIQLYGNSNDFKLSDLPEELIERKVQLCYELLEVAEILDPGLSRFRGILLYELQAAMVIQTRKDFCKELITKSEAENKLRKSLDILHESCKILLVEPEFKETLQEKLESLNNMLEI